ncbi:MAG TPA: NADH-quinone oxidoreductase subunit C [Gammaproteobacteria bacterium]|nr:NADH-quinone oxidoreductase subunit C [Gammaproteobacteria bacterium]
MQRLEELYKQIFEQIGDKISANQIAFQELTLELAPEHLLEVCLFLKETSLLKFEMLMDVCGVDYLDYGVSEWTTFESTKTGFSRGVERRDGERESLNGANMISNKPRFAVVYHLLSITHNHRIRLKVFANGEPPMVPSVVNIWNSANWFEREAFDLFGIHFEGHPDLRRILTDYGFIGHPFRKDFPLIGNVEMRYSASEQRVVYEPVSIQARTLVPKTIRNPRPNIPPNPPVKEGANKEGGIK